MGIDSSKSLQQQFEQLSFLSDDKIETIWSHIRDFQDRNKIIFIGTDLASVFNDQISKKLDSSEKYALQLNHKESNYLHAFNKAANVNLVIPEDYAGSLSRLIKLNVLAFISFHIYFEIFSQSLYPIEKEEIRKEYQKILAQQNSAEKKLKFDVGDVYENLSYDDVINQLLKDIKMNQIDNILRYVRNFFDESKDLKNFFSNNQLTKFEIQARKMSKNLEVINFKLKRETSVPLYSEEYDLIFVDREEISTDIKFLINYLANIRYCLVKKNYNSQAIKGNPNISMILFKIQTFFRDIKDFKPKNDPVKKITAQSYSMTATRAVTQRQNKDYYDSADELEFLSNWELNGYLALKLTDNEKEYSKKFYEKIQKIDMRNRMDLISFLDEHFSFKKSEKDSSVGFPNYGNTCYLNVGMQVMKALKYDVLWQHLFDFEDETFLNLYIVLRYWSKNTLEQNPVNEARIITHFKSFINGFFRKNNYNDFTYLKCNDSSSFVLNTFNLLVKRSLKLDSLVSNIENKLIEVDECESEESLQEAIYKNLNIIDELTKSQPYLFSIYTYFVTKDQNGNLNCIKPYFDISENVYNKFKSIKSFFQSRNDTVFIKYPKVLVVKLKTEKDRRIFEKVEHYFEVENILGEKYIYNLKAITFVTGKRGGHTFSYCFYDNNWIGYDDSHVKKIDYFPMDIVYTLNYELKKID